MKLFCLPYAGGAADFFFPLSKCLGESVEVTALEYSGHGKRYKESLYTSFSELLSDIEAFFRAAYAAGEPYAIFGYSMGSIVAADLVNSLAKQGLEPPQHVFLAAHAPHAMLEAIDSDGVISDEWVKERTIGFGGVPEHLIHNRPYWRLYMPIYKADYRIIRSYRFEDLCLRTTVPATVFYSEEDTPEALIKDWKNYFISECEFVKFAGNHFFINEHTQEIADIIRDRLCHRGNQCGI